MKRAVFLLLALLAICNSSRFCRPVILISLSLVIIIIRLFMQVLCLYFFV